ncbi:hypothetical protein N8J89_31570 [Crossiella sp. CA-258035]|uniref:hypothetical protein n=1 Tax=Crossiella sp. CA-258035 TaxID=2981138 RepID=UPI0024BD11DA|nr:hypothetical protein [Crossiella sp. CA-258035]WHT17632.1 hypothetical protein N8J89_31570 [Crossiella sp. CA-258035]
MATQQLTLTAPSGRRVSVTLPAHTPVSSVAAGIRFAGGVHGTGFQIGSRGYHEFAVTQVAPMRQRERFLVHGREVVVAEAIDGQSSLATLFGVYHELMTVYSGPAPHRDAVFALFNSLRVQDTVAGMVVRPRSATMLELMSEQIMLAVRDHGSLSIPGPRQAAGLTPRFAGARTRHGEVWKTPYPGAAGSARASEHAFVLGCPAGTAEVHLCDTGATTERQRLDWLNEINVVWHKAN